MLDSESSRISSNSRPLAYSEFNDGPVYCFGILSAFLILVTALDQNRGPVAVAAIVAAAATFGYILGGYRPSLSDDWVVRQCNLVAGDLAEIDAGFERREGRFLTLTSLLMAAYVVFYWYATWNLSTAVEAQTISWLVVVLACVTIASFGACSVRYAAYVRMANLLDAALKLPKPPERLIPFLRLAVFRREQLFEPAGNLFVTLGITATFLGLAVGLVTLDLSQFFPQAGATVAQTAARGPTTVASLGSFVGCMGLALGMSMLGVLTSMAAQWLRGYGPAEPTEVLLARAQERLAPPARSTADSGGKGRPATPGAGE